MDSQHEHDGSTGYTACVACGHNSKEMRHSPIGTVAHRKTTQISHEGDVLPPTAPLVRLEHLTSVLGNALCDCQLLDKRCCLPVVSVIALKISRIQQKDVYFARLPAPYCNFRQLGCWSHQSKCWCTVLLRHDR